jgi:hypothetical protein
MQRTFDVGLINSVIKHPYIWSKIADGEDIEEFAPPMAGIHYLYEEGVLFILNKIGEEWHIHANVIPEHKKKASRCASDALRYAFDDLNAERIFAEIPVKYENVYRFALKFMKDAGMRDGEHLMILERKLWAS